jgi:hypothetical protein
MRTKIARSVWVTWAARCWLVAALS